MTTALASGLFGLVMLGFGKAFYDPDATKLGAGLVAFSLVMVTIGTVFSWLS